VRPKNISHGKSNPAGSHSGAGFVLDVGPTFNRIVWCAAEWMRSATAIAPVQPWRLDDDVLVKSAAAINDNLLHH